MKIERNYEGFKIEIELTAEEVHEAYCEQEHIYDVKEILYFIENTDLDLYHVAESELRTHAEEIAYEMRSLIDNECLDWFEACDQAIKNFCGINNRKE